MGIWRQERYGTGRCVNCGYLGKRSTKLAEKCFYADQKDRSFGRFNKHETLDGGLTSLSTIPWCSVGKADLYAELTDMGANVHQVHKVREVIEKDRKCPSWYPWREFASPKEHFEESMMLAMEKRREEFEERIERDRRRFERRMESSRRNFELKLSRNARNLVIWIAIAAGVLALAEVVAALLGLTPDSWILSHFR